MTAPGKALVGPLPTVSFYGGPLGPPVKVAYDVPHNTLDPRYRLCTDHHVACDCREAEHAENGREHVLEWRIVHDAAALALAGHQVTYPMGLRTVEQIVFRLCLCSGCVIHRETSTLLSFRSINYVTGRVEPRPAARVPF